MNILQRIVLEIIWLQCWIVGHLPHSIQFRFLAPALSFILHRVLHYRQKVVDKNLLMSFPKKSVEERSDIRKRFYTTLSEVMISTMALANKRSYNNIIQKGREHFDGDINDLATFATEQSWVALTAHFGLWEYLLFWSKFSSQRLLAVYHPLESKIFDRLLRRLRGHYKVQPIPSKEVLRFVVRNGKTYRGESYLLGLIADQSPRNRPHTKWNKFLGQDTKFFDGGEKIAMKIGLPVRFIYQHRIAPGRYEIRYRPIWDGVEEVEPNEITSRYIALLEEAIRETPEMWLWSHRRWKAKRPAEESTQAEQVETNS